MSDLDRKSLIIKLGLPPLLTICFMMGLFYVNYMYPLGEYALDYGDLLNQFAHLFCQFKDILDGESSIFLNFKNAGGMSFYGVFFYYLSSPFSLLVKFVPKENIFNFCNILIVLKMAASAFTAAYCFTYLKRKLSTCYVVLLSLMYALNFYTIWFYCILSWLDAVYLFPLLIVGLVRLVEEGKPLFYSFILVCFCFTNFYLTYMVAIFVFIFMLVYLLIHRKDRDCGQICKNFLLYSFLAVLVSTIVWLPCLHQYLESARGEMTTLETIRSSSLFFQYDQPLFIVVAGSGLSLALLGYNFFVLKTKDPYYKLFLVLLALLVLPIFLEPINLVWHTGNYSSYPYRYGYMSVFLLLLCSAYTLDNEIIKKVSVKKSSIFLFLILILSFSCKMDFYKFLYVIISIYFVIYIGFIKKIISKEMFIFLLSCLFILEFSFYFRIRMSFLDEFHCSGAFISQYQKFVNCEKKLDRDHFYRVKSNKSYILNKADSSNEIGGFGLNSISHFTSLTSFGYIKTMQQLGYSTWWMIVKSIGGTNLTDALLCVKYRLEGQKTLDNCVHTNSEFLPLGLILERGTLKDCEFIPEYLGRPEVQGYISESIIGKNITELYVPEEDVSKKNGSYRFFKGDSVHYSVKVDKQKSLYFDISNRFTTDINSSMFGAINLEINDKKIVENFPNSDINCLLFLGNHENEKVKVTVRFNKDVTCSSFGLFGVDINELHKFCREAKGAELNVKGSGLYGQCSTDEDSTLFLSLPYNDNFVVKVNGQKVSYQRVLTGFIAFEVPKGNSEISITFIPKGFVAGTMASLIGLGLTAIVFKFKRHIDDHTKMNKICQVITMILCISVVVCVYVLSVLAKVLMLAGFM